MSLRALYRSIFFAIIAVLSLTSCRKNEAIPERLEDQGAITEENNGVALAFSAAPNGKLKLFVKGPDGKPLDKGVSGAVIVQGAEPKAEAVKVAFVPEPKTGLLVAAMPELVDDVTEVKYELNVNDKPINGVLHLPAGGTKELEETAKVAVKVKIPAGQKGPNGGILQVVDDDVVEIVAGQKNGTVHAYVLDPSLKPVRLGDRKLKIAFVTSKGPDVVVLSPDPGGTFFVGKLKVIENPVKITVALTHHDHTEVVLCGYEPGKVIVVGPRAPGLVILAAVSWDVDVVIAPPRPVVIAPPRPGVVVQPQPGVVVQPQPVVVVQPRPVIMMHGKGKGKGKWKWKKH
jgi:hypothetical protein